MPTASRPKLADRLSRLEGGAGWRVASQRAYRLAAADAEDVFQEAFLRTWQNLDRIEGDAALRPWLGQVTRRLCLDRLRRVREYAAADLPEPRGGHVDTALATVEEAIDVRAALAGLAEPCRDILDRFFARDQSYATIGAELDLPPGTIASRISRCLARLRERLDQVAAVVVEQVRGLAARARTGAAGV